MGDDLELAQITIELSRRRLELKRKLGSLDVGDMRRYPLESAVHSIKAAELALETARVAITSQEALR